MKISICMILTLAAAMTQALADEDRMRTVVWVDRMASEHDIYTLTNRLTELTGEGIWTGDIGCAWARLPDTNQHGFALSFYADKIMCPIEIEPGATNWMPLSAYVGSNWTTSELEVPADAYWMEGVEYPLQILQENGFINMEDFE